MIHKNELMRCLLILVIALGSLILNGQEDADALFIKKIHDRTLTDGECFDWLTHLSEEIGGRLAGSTQAEEAIPEAPDEMTKLYGPLLDAVIGALTRLDSRAEEDLTYD